MIQMYAIISDLHRGPPKDPATDFYKNTNLALFLQVMHLKDIRVILNGDTEELWVFDQCDVEWSNRLSTEAIHRYVFAIVTGNHDNVDHICGRETVPHVILGNDDWLVWHGADLDPWNSPPFTWIGKAATVTVSSFERLLHRPGLSSSWGSWIDKHLSRGHYADAAGRASYKSAAVERAHAFGCKGAILGHTHHFVPLSAGAGYGNSGTWINTHKDVLFVEVDER